MSNQVAHQMIDVPSVMDHYIGLRISVPVAIESRFGER